MHISIVFFPAASVVVTAGIDYCWLFPVAVVDTETLPALFSPPTVHCPTAPLHVPPTADTTPYPPADCPDAHHKGL